MGIPRLLSYLQPYTNTTSLKDCNIIIDGPGFAYYIYYSLSAQHTYYEDAIRAAPSYEELGEAALAFLDKLQEHKIVV